MLTVKKKQQVVRTVVKTMMGNDDDDDDDDDDGNGNHDHDDDEDDDDDDDDEDEDGDADGDGVTGDDGGDSAFRQEEEDDDDAYGVSQDKERLEVILCPTFRTLNPETATSEPEQSLHPTPETDAS